MVVSLDGKVTGDFLYTPEGTAAAEVYYQLNLDYGADGFACGRITMEGSFTGGYYPDLTAYPSAQGYRWKMDYIPDSLSGFYAVAFDPHGRLGWQSDKIQDPDSDPGYDGAQIIEIVTEQVDARYLGYLEQMGIAYLFAGKEEIDIPLALLKLRRFFGIQTLLLEGGSILNGAFQRCGVVDELSLVVAPMVANTGDKPLFMDSTMAAFRLQEAKTTDGVVWMHYKRHEE
jgi:riboflavin biosynthesis pyrimidine reductase